MWDDSAEHKRRHQELTRSRGLTDTVRGGSVISRSRLATAAPAVEFADNNNDEMCAAAKSQPPDVAKVVTFLTDEGASTANVRARNDAGQNYLQIVCAEEYPEVVSHLLKRGSNVDNQDNAGLTPLHTACSYGNLETVRLLLVGGANLSLLDHAGNSPVHLAALQGHLEVVKELIGCAVRVSFLLYSLCLLHHQPQRTLRKHESLWPRHPRSHTSAQGGLWRQSCHLRAAAGEGQHDRRRARLAGQHAAAAR
jgi:hypothetical protein